MKTKILLVEDDPSIALGLEEIFKKEGFMVSRCSRGDKALAAVDEHQPNLVVLDVMLPGKNGYEICRKLRETKSALPILMLTAKGQELDKVVGFQAGADDYLTKPFGVKELLARIHALLRRTGAAPGKAETNDNQTFTIGDAQINPQTFQVTRGKKTVDLTPRELKLLQLFWVNPGIVLSRDRLLNDVWGYHYYGTTRTLDQVIVQLRKKLGDTGQSPRHLLTVHGVGYKLVL